MSIFKQLKSARALSLLRTRTPCRCFLTPSPMPCFRPRLNNMTNKQRGLGRISERFYGTVHSFVFRNNFSRMQEETKRPKRELLPQNKSLLQDSLFQDLSNSFNYICNHVKLVKIPFSILNLNCILIDLLSLYLPSVLPNVQLLRSDQMKTIKSA